VISDHSQVIDMFIAVDGHVGTQAVRLYASENCETDTVKDASVCVCV